MGKYIDADALKEKIDSMGNGRPLSFLGARILVTIDESPSIDIVRCKECKHWWNEYGDSACMLHSDFTVNADDFCSYGEREGE